MRQNTRRLQIRLFLSVLGFWGVTATPARAAPTPRVTSRATPAPMIVPTVNPFDGAELGADYLAFMVPLEQMVGPARRKERFVPHDYTLGEGLVLLDATRFEPVNPNSAAEAAQQLAKIITKDPEYTQPLEAALIDAQIVAEGLAQQINAEHTVAYAMMFFVSSLYNVANFDSDIPNLVQIAMWNHFNRVLGSEYAFQKMNDSQKQALYDRLLALGLMVQVGYQTSLERQDLERALNFKSFANDLLRDILGLSQETPLEAYQFPFALKEK
jgi:hypothetical protein